MTTSAGYVLPDGTTVTMRAEYQTMDYEGSLVYDRDWSGYDENGHFHTATSNGKYPTLREQWIRGHCYMCNDCHEEGEISDGFECRWCGTDVFPGTRYSPPGTKQFLTYVEYRRQGWVTVAAEDAQQMLISGEASSIEYGHSGMLRVHIDQLLTKQQVEDLVNV